MIGDWVFLDWVNVVLALLGLGELALGLRVLTTRKAPGLTEPGEIRRYGVALTLLSTVFLGQVVGYVGVRLELFSSTVRGLFLLAGLAVGAVALIRHWPLLRRAGAPRRRREAENPAGPGTEDTGPDRVVPGDQA